jgi:acetyl esterase
MQTIFFPLPSLIAVEILKEHDEMDVKPLHSLSAEDARDQSSLADAVKKVADRHDREIEETGKTENIDIKLSNVDLKGRIYRPDGDGPFPVILYIHGGGWVVGDLDDYDAAARALSKAANALVVSSHYRQAPEHKFPTAHNDVYGAYQWTMENAGRWSGNGKKVAIVGESAGGNMAAAATIMARHEKIQLPVHQVLIYPIASTKMDTESYRQYENAKPLNAATMKWFFDQSLGNPADASDPKIALLEEKDFKGLPPVTIITAEIDPLRSEGEALAKKYEDAGVQVTYRNFEGVTHEFFGMVPALDKAQQAVDFVASQLKQSFGQDAADSRPAADVTRGRDVGTGIESGSGTATGGTGAGGTSTGEYRGTGSGTAADTGALRSDPDRSATGSQQDRSATERQQDRSSGTDRSATGTTPDDPTGSDGNDTRTQSPSSPDRSGGSQEIER